MNTIRTYHILKEVRNVSTVMSHSDAIEVMSANKLELWGLFVSRKGSLYQSEPPCPPPMPKTIILLQPFFALIFDFLVLFYSFNLSLYLSSSFNFLSHFHFALSLIMFFFSEWQWLCDIFPGTVQGCMYLRKKISAMSFGGKIWKGEEKKW